VARSRPVPKERKRPQHPAPADLHPYALHMLATGRSVRITGGPQAATIRWREYWRQHGDAALAEWIAEAPGTRPIWWWKLRGAAWVDETPDFTWWTPQGEAREVAEEFERLREMGELTAREIELYEAGEIPPGVVDDD